jgi:hypothetical protein
MQANDRKRPYHLTVTTILRDPYGEPTRIGAVTYLVTQDELSASDWPITSAYPLERPPHNDNLPPFDGRPAGQIITQVTLSIVPDREVVTTTDREPSDG